MENNTIELFQYGIIEGLYSANGKINGWRVDGQAAGVFFQEELAGPDGMNFYLLIDRDTTQDGKIKAAKMLRDFRDVCKIRVIRVDRRRG